MTEIGHLCGKPLSICEYVIQALGGVWHPEHFTCACCHLSLIHEDFFEHDAEPYCTECHLSLFATCFSNNFGARCGGCHQPILGDFITVTDKPWHEQCFRCHECSQNLYGRNFCAKDGLLYCESHQQNFTSLICASCSQPIAGRCINAMGKRFHLQHFVCTYCLRPLNTGTFKERASKPYCSACFRQLFS
ncbi:unnamed protein product [Schistocephalus solidus]|uniref:LIM zinc-binding domain-containing protein n=1 Tax=Schistocephalus solidus TaxID=70667 RepID=A0A3P7C1U5_SCHSO|nr:unnamed protein product [Schistocephalus solidus]